MQAVNANILYTGQMAWAESLASCKLCEERDNRDVMPLIEQQQLHRSRHTRPRNVGARHG